MLYDIQDYWVFVLCPSSGILKNRKPTTFRKQIHFPKRRVLLFFGIPDDGRSLKTQ
jgi:hypothetical protein